MIASVIIPCYERNELLNRAVCSVIDCEGGEQVEIIVVDDHSPDPVECPILREQDRIIRLEKNSGCSIARNVGIEAANGEMIYLLDSDDLYLERDFIRDHKNYRNEEAIFYSEIDSQGFSSNYPDQLQEENYFNSIFFRFPHVGQSSSLCFPKKVGIRFDETFTKHDDWDLIFCQAIRKGIDVRKIEGRIFFDRSDRTSISRRPNGEESLPWVKKIQEELAHDRNFDQTQFRFHILSQYPPQYSWFDYFAKGLRLLMTRKTALRPFLVKGGHRMIALGNRLAGRS